MSGAPPPYTGPHESRAPQIIIGNVVTFVFATVFVFARLWSRTIILRIFPLEDWLIMLGWLCALGNFFLAILATHYGAGRHQGDIPIEHVIPLFKDNYADRILYQIGLTITKLSLCTMYLRLFGTQTADRIFLWSVNVLLITSTIGLTLFNIFSCKPISHAWNIFEAGTCANDVPGFWTSFAVAISTDVALLLFSTFKVKQLQMAQRQKNAMYITVGVGWLVVVAAIVRAVKIAAVIKDSDDASWRTYDTSIWGSAEVNIALACTAAVAIKPLLKIIMPSFIKSLSNKLTTSGGRYGGTSAVKSRTQVTNRGTVRDEDEEVMLDDRRQIMKTNEVVVVQSSINEEGHKEDV